MNIQVGNDFGRGVLPQTPLFSMYLRAPAWAETLGTTTETFASTVTLLGAPPTTLLQTGNSPPNTAAGSAATRTAREGRSISDRRRSTRCQKGRLPLILYENRALVRTSRKRYVTFGRPSALSGPARTAVEIQMGRLYKRAVK